MNSVTCYGGVGTIGGNKILLDLSDSSIFLDFGLNFGEEGKFFEEFLQPRSASKFHDLMRLDLLPTLDGIYRQDSFRPDGIDGLDDNPSKSLWRCDLQSYDDAKSNGDWHPDAVFISHAHLDHCGYLPYLGNMPVICSPETKTLMTAFENIGNLTGFDNDLTKFERRCIRYLSQRAYFPGAPKIEKGEVTERTIDQLKDRDTIQIGTDDIALEAIEVGHSIPGSLAALIESKDKQVVYTGDLRFHGRKKTKLADILEGVKPDVMLCEGTRINEDKPDDEGEVQRKLIDVFMDTDGLAMVGFAWKDLERYETVKQAAQEVGRIPVFDPRLAYIKARIDQSIYEEDAKVFIERTENMLYSEGDYTKCKHKCGEIPVSEWSYKEDIKDVIHLEMGVTAVDIMKNPENYVLQLDYYRFKNLVDINPPKGSKYVRAQSEPFNEEMELSERRLINWLKHFGINKERNYKPIHIHASGHACGSEIQDMIELIQPKILVPIHTENPSMFKNEHGAVTVPCIGETIGF